MKVLTAGMKPKSSSSKSGGKNSNSKHHHQQQHQQQQNAVVVDTVANASDNDNDDDDNNNSNTLLVPLNHDCAQQQQQQQRRMDEIMQQPQQTNSSQANQQEQEQLLLDDLYYSAPPTSSSTVVVQNSVELLVAEETEKYYAQKKGSKSTEYLWLAICFFGIMGSFVAYGLLLEYATSGGKQLHELSFLFITSLLYTMTASVGRYARAEKPSTIPPAQFAVLGLTSMGSTFFSVRALRYVIYPIQVLAKSCKPVPVMLMGALMGKKYPMKKYLKVALIVAGVGLFMGGGGNKKKSSTNPTDDKDASSQLIGVTLLFISLCFDGGTGAYEDKLMSVHSVGPFDLMYNIQLGKTILAGIGLIILNQVHIFAQMCQDMGFLLVALGLSGAIGQVFIFVTIAKFGALTCAIIGLARKVATLVASIYFYGHSLSKIQAFGLLISIGAMVNDFFGKKDKKGGHGHGGHGGAVKQGEEFSEEQRPMLPSVPEAELEMGNVDTRR